MPSFNHVTLIGNVTRTPEERSFGDNKKVVKFGLAVNEKYNGEDKTCFVDCVAFGRVGEVVASYVNKGHPLFVEGKLNYSTWQDRDSGSKRSKLEVVVRSVQLLRSPAQSEPKEKAQDPTEEYGSIPF